MQPTLTDIELWNRFAAGDKEAYDALFRRFYPRLFQYGRKIVSDTEVVEDAVQELFLELWQKPAAQALQSVQAYLLKALKFKLYKTFRHNKRTAGNDAADGLFELSPETVHEEKEKSEEQTARIFAALAQLSPRQKEIIYLKIYKNLSYEEVSEIMDIHYGVARNLLCAALKAFKKAYAFGAPAAALLLLLCQ